MASSILFSEKRKADNGTVEHRMDGQSPSPKADKKARGSSPGSKRTTSVELQANAVPIDVREYIINESNSVTALIEDAKEHEAQIHTLIDKINEGIARENELQEALKLQQFNEDKQSTAAAAQKISEDERREAADSRIEDLQAANEKMRDELNKEKETVGKSSRSPFLEAHSLRKRLEEARLEEEQAQDKCRETTAEMKKRIAKAEGEVKKETDAAEKIRAQMNRDSQTLQDLA